MNPEMEKLKKWVISTGVAVLGGAIAGAFAAMMDPVKYSITQDLFSGKLWKYFFMGAALTLGGILLHSPLGQKMISITKQSKEQLEQTQKELNQAKADLKGKQ